MTCFAFCAESCYFYRAAHGSIVCFHLIHFMKFHHLCFNTVVMSTCKVWSEFHMFVIHHLCTRQSVTQTQKADKQTSRQNSISLHSHTPAHTPAHVHMHMLKCHRYKSYTHMKAQMHSKTYSHTHTHTHSCSKDVAVQMCVLNCTGCDATHEWLSRRLDDRCSTLVQALFQTHTHTNTNTHVHS